MNFLERTIATVAPTTALNRAFARERLKFFSHDAASPGRRRGGSGGRMKNASSESWRMGRDRIELMWQARDLHRNFGILQGMVSRIVQYATDDILYIASTGDKVADGEYQAYMREWAEKADVTGRHQLGALLRMAESAVLVDGDHGWNMVDVEENGEWQIRIQPIEADRIGNVLNPSDAGNPLCIGGVNIDEVGRVLSYSIYKRDRITSNVTFEHEVPADCFLHIFDPWRVDQYRGVTALAAALAPARDLYEIADAEMMAAKWQVGHAGMIYTDDPFKPGSDSAWNATDASAGSGGASRPSEISMEAGKVLRLTQGEKVQFAPGAMRPSGAFMALYSATVRAICQPLNMPYGFLYDMSALSGHTGRVEIAQATRAIARLQKLLIAQALNPVRDRVISRAISTGQLPFHPNWRQGRWGFGATLTGDYGNDVNAKLQLLNAGVITVSDLISDNGGNFEDVARRAASEVKFYQGLASETQVPIELITARLTNPTQTLAAINTPPPQPPQGLVPQGSDTKPLLEVLKQAGEGTMDRKSAVATLVTLYGIPPQDAELMVPRPSPRPEASTPAVNPQPESEE
jgi:lambda family phage portal protein